MQQPYEIDSKTTKKIVSDVVDRLYKLSSSQRKVFMDHLFNDDYPFSAFQDSVLNISNLETRLDVFCNIVEEIGDKRAKIRFYIYLICEIGGYKQRPLDRITDPRAIEMFEIPGSIEKSLKLIDPSQHHAVLTQLTATNLLDTGFTLSNGKLLKSSDSSRKRKNDDDLAPMPKKQKIEIDSEAVSLILKHYFKKDDNEKTRKTLNNCDLQFWKTFQEKIHSAANPFPTFLICLERVEQKNEKSKLVHGFLRPPVKYTKDLRNIDKYKRMPLYEPSRDLLSGENFAKVKGLLRETQEHSHQTYFAQHMESKNIVTIDSLEKSPVETPDISMEAEKPKNTFNRNRLFADKTEEILKMINIKPGDVNALATKEDYENFSKFWD